jgi:hypothetical protein
MATLTAEQIVGLKDSIAALIEKEKQVKNWSISTINDLVDGVQTIVKEIETVSENLKKLTSQEKRELAINLIYPYISLSWLPWGIGKLIPESIVKQGIGLLIDYTVSLFNKLMGNKWLLTLQK